MLHAVRQARHKRYNAFAPITSQNASIINETSFLIHSKHLWFISVSISISITSVTQAYHFDSNHINQISSINSPRFQACTDLECSTIDTALCQITNRSILTQSIGDHQSSGTNIEYRRSAWVSQISTARSCSLFLISYCSHFPTSSINAGKHPSLLCLDYLVPGTRLTQTYI